MLSTTEAAKGRASPRPAVQSLTVTRRRRRTLSRSTSLFLVFACEQVRNGRSLQQATSAPETRDLINVAELGQANRQLAFSRLVLATPFLREQQSREGCHAADRHREIAAREWKSGLSQSDLLQRSGQVVDHLSRISRTRCSGRQWP